MPGGGCDPRPNRHRSTSPINAPLGNPDRPPLVIRDASSLTLAKHLRPMLPCTAATPDHPSFHRSGQVHDADTVMAAPTAWNWPLAQFGRPDAK